MPVRLSDSKRISALIFGDIFANLIAHPTMFRGVLAVPEPAEPAYPSAKQQPAQRKSPGQ